MFDSTYFLMMKHFKVIKVDELFYSRYWTMMALQSCNLLLKFDTIYCSMLTLHQRYISDWEMIA